MITNLECAILSGAVYAGPTQYFHDIRFSILSRGVANIKNGWAMVMDVDPGMRSQDNCYAALYIKFERGEASDAVVAIRGTVTKDVKDVLVDFISWEPNILESGIHSERPFFYNKVLHFVSKSREYLHQHFPQVYFSSGLILTGHSLGGALAQLVSLIALPLQAVVFNSPGCGEIHGVDLARAHWVSNINAHYGIIDKIGKVVGQLTLVDIPEDEDQARALYEHYQLDKKLTDFFHVSHFTLVRAGLILESAASAPNMAGIQKDLKTCDRAYPHWRELFQREACQTKVLGKDVVDIVIAQHSISHMIMTLESGAYAALGFERVG